MHSDSISLCHNNGYVFVIPHLEDSNKYFLPRNQALSKTWPHIQDTEANGLQQVWG